MNISRGKVIVNRGSAICNVCRLTARNEEELKDHMIHAHNYDTHPDDKKNITNSTHKET